MIRGKWILENLLGVPPPPPPPNVPALDDVKTVRRDAPVRERLAEHRTNPACVGCHRLTDPVGFALENYDAVGRWRTLDGGVPIDASGALFDGTEFNGVRRPPGGDPRIVRNCSSGRCRKAADVRHGPRRRVLRRAGHPQDRPRRQRQGLPLLVARHGHREQRAVPDEARRRRFRLV